VVGVLVGLRSAQRLLSGICDQMTLFGQHFFKKAGLELDGRGALLLNGIGILLGYFLTLMHRLKSGGLERHVPAS